MDIISTHEFHALCDRNDIKLIKTTYNRPKLFETNNNEMIKVFYPRKKIISSDKHKPYALRFCSNAERLRNLGFKTPLIKSIQFCRDLNIYIITYQKLNGLDARVLTINDQNIIHDIASYLADLHQKGVFFRSIHLENMLRQSNGDLALIDIVDVQFKKSSLSTYLRFRNLKHLFLVKDDKKFWENYGVKNFLKTYFKFTKLSYFSRIILLGLIIYTKYV